MSDQQSRIVAEAIQLLMQSEFPSFQSRVKPTGEIQFRWKANGIYKACLGRIVKNEYLEVSSGTVFLGDEENLKELFKNH